MKYAKIAVFVLYFKKMTKSVRLFAYYTANRMYWFGGFEYFVKSRFEREPLILDK